MSSTRRVFISVFLTSGRLLAAVTEVNNTFGEKHVYVLSDNLQANGDFPACFQAEKAFHVSPFNNMDGTYRFTFADIREQLDICIDLHRKGEHILRARPAGRPFAADAVQSYENSAPTPHMASLDHFQNLSGSI